MPYTYLSEEDAVLIHGLLVKKIGGLHGIRDISDLVSVVNLPAQVAFGKETYPDVFTKAAVYLRGFLLKFPFLDVNEGVAITASALFLDMNGYELRCRRGDIEHFVIRVTTDMLSLEDIAAWLKKHAKKK